MTAPAPRGHAFALAYYCSPRISKLFPPLLRNGTGKEWDGDAASGRTAIHGPSFALATPSVPATHAPSALTPGRRWMRLSRQPKAVLFPGVGHSLVTETPCPVSRFTLRSLRDLPFPSIPCHPPYPRFTLRPYGNGICVNLCKSVDNPLRPPLSPVQSTFRIFCPHPFPSMLLCGPCVLCG